MTEDPGTRSAVGEELEQSPSSVHDDIVKRLLDYQRQLRDEKGDVATPDRPSVTDDTMLDAPSASTVVGVDTEAGTDALVEEHVVEVPTVETRAAEPRTVEPTASEAPDAELAWAESPAATTSETALQMVSDLRKRFQDLAIEADERLSEIEGSLRASAEQPDLGQSRS